MVLLCRELGKISSQTGKWKGAPTNLSKWRNVLDIFDAKLYICNFSFEFLESCSCNKFRLWYIVFLMLSGLLSFSPFPTPPGPELKVMKQDVQESLVVEEMLRWFRMNLPPFHLIFLLDSLCVFVWMCSRKRSYHSGCTACFVYLLGQANFLFSVSTSLSNNF